MTTGRLQEVPWISVLRGLAGLLALLVAWLHFLHPRLGLQRLLLYIELGTLYDPRPPLFVLTALIIGVGILMWFRRGSRRLIYGGGIVLMLILILGYISWHTVLDHGAFWPYLGTHTHEDTPFLQTIVHHLMEERLAGISKLAEAALLVLLVLLLRYDRSP